MDLRDRDESAFAQYSTFEVAKRNYKLTVGGYSGTAGDTETNQAKPCSVPEKAISPKSWLFVLNMLLLPLQDIIVDHSYSFLFAVAVKNQFESLCLI